MTLRFPMGFRSFVRASFIFLVVFSASSISAESTSNDFDKFSEFTEGSNLQMDFSIVDQLLHAGVVNMGPSTRAYARKTRATTGTLLRQNVDGATENEANRFFYENLKHDQADILLLRQELEAIPSTTPLKQYTKEAQLAYWLNLYKVTLINELAVIYPLNNLKPVLTGDDSLLDKKLLVVEGIPLSLNDIHYKIVPLLYPDDPFFIYGFHQGIKGSPNIRQKAYTANDVKKSLLDNGREFVNSNRGTQFNGGESVVRISSFYERNAELFQDFENDIKSHILKYANASIEASVKTAETFIANISNWRITDLYGSIRRRDHGVYVVSGDGARLSASNKLSPEQAKQLQTLFRVRAINFGGGSVTVTDLPSSEEHTEEKDDKDE